MLYLFDLLLFQFSDCRSYAVCGNWFRLRMAHFSVSCDSIASLFIFVIVRIGFEPCNNHYLAAFVLPSPAFVARCCVTCHGYLSLNLSLALELLFKKAVQCVNLRAKCRFSYGCVFCYCSAPLCNCEVCVYVTGA